MQHPQQRMILRPDRDRQEDTKPLAVVIKEIVIPLSLPNALGYLHCQPRHHQSTHIHTFMAQLAIGELRSRLNAREDLPTEAATVLILQLGEAVAECSANLHLERHAFFVHGREAVVRVMPVFVVGIGGRAGPRPGPRLAPQLVDTLDPAVVVG